MEIGGSDGQRGRRARVTHEHEGQSWLATRWRIEVLVKMCACAPGRVTQARPVQTA